MRPTAQATVKCVQECRLEFGDPKADAFGASPMTSFAPGVFWREGKEFPMREIEAAMLIHHYPDCFESEDVDYELLESYQEAYPDSFV